MKRINGVRIYATLLALTLSLTATAGATGATPANEAITSNTATTAMVPNADTGDGIKHSIIGKLCM